MDSRLTKFTTHDLVMVGIFNAALVLFFYGTTIVLHFIPFLWGAMDPVLCFVLAPIFLLMVVRVPKTGVLTIHGFIIGIVHAAIGWWPGLVAGIVGGTVADAFAVAAGGYKKKTVVYGSISLFFLVKIALFYSPMYLFMYLPWFDDVLSMWPKESIEKYTVVYVIGVLVFSLIACFAGLLFGQRMLSRHFKNSSVAC
ncbi:MptD family putative ECF transporter S component [Halodesulfovibrio sp.]|jgi:putative ECF transporter S component (TIGR02185 family)|uniref:MptD family putative ECF transporter S component n=1 Tax=Halodesulfovibrio sp. TaxID=1912772 RepID=UPI0025F74481|nr:MptD family putative ECF transporter S component [Halodesulfovibrio sp.]MCT4626410.1 MptD family putative ECF transporter S component [Halodesulfovibrio sp.]